LIKNIDSEKALFDKSNFFLEKLLLHSKANVPFYNNELEFLGYKNNNSMYNDFKGLPLLTKSNIRNNIDELTSTDVKKRKSYLNTSGGSTGEPIRFIQDKLYKKWSMASVRYYYENIIGIDEIAVKKALFWGSPRDLIAGSIGLRAKMINWLTNTKFLNFFRINEQDMERYVKFINNYKPVVIRSYVTFLYELSNFIEKRGLSIHQPKVIISTAEKLYNDVRENIENVFGTKVYDFYGTREVNGVAGECKEGLLHVFMFNNYVEVLDNDNNPVREGETGKIVVTTLHNYSMPLIRYDIGDMATLGPKKCKCGNLLPTFKEVTGRIYDYFVKEDGSIIHGGYFVYLFRIRDWIKSFKVIQEDYRKIRILAVLDGNINNSERQDIDNKIRLVMGKQCDILWEIVDEIPRTQNGKFVFTTSLLHHK
jgi:phenylacetate-CoA ligase